MSLDALDELARRGLWDPDAPDDGERRDSLRALLAVGVSVDEIAAALETGDLGGLMTRHVLWPEGFTLSVADVAERVGLDEALIRRAWRANGFPDPGDGPAFSTADLPLFEALAVGVEVFDEESLLHFSRVIGSATERIAEAAVSMFASDVIAPREDAGEDFEPAQTLAPAAIASFDAVTGAVSPVLRHHFARAGSLWRLSRTPGASDTAQLAVGFCDLSGSTGLAHRLAPRDLTRALLVLEAAATEVVVARRGRVVKLVGDGVLFVNPVASAAIETAVDLIAHVAADPVLPPLRAGVAFGEVVPRHGDVFGPVVNLAARLADAAEPGSVLVEAEASARLHAAAGIDLVAAGARALRGFDAPVVVHRARRGVREQPT